MTAILYHCFRLFSSDLLGKTDSTELVSVYGRIPVMNLTPAFSTNVQTAKKCRPS